MLTNLAKQIVRTFAKNKLKSKIAKERNQAQVKAPPQSAITSFTLSQTYKIHPFIQFIPIYAVSGFLFIQLPNPFTNYFYYSLVGLEKWGFTCTMLNVLHTQNKIYRGITIAGAIGLNLLPIQSIWSIGTQFLQIFLIANSDSKKMKENVQLSEEQQTILMVRMKRSLLLILIGVATLLYKLMYQYEIFKIEKKIQDYNQLNQNA